MRSPREEAAREEDVRGSGETVCVDVAGLLSVYSLRGDHAIWRCFCQRRGGGIGTAAERGEWRLSSREHREMEQHVFPLKGCAIARIEGRIVASSLLRKERRSSTSPLLMVSDTEPLLS